MTTWSISRLNRSPADDVRGWTDKVLQRANGTLDELARRRSDLRDDDRKLVDELLSRRRTLPDRLGELLPASVDTMKIRHHGDFHLGQMLIVKDDVFIIDFEGEPRRSIEDRRRKAPAARDVAGLIRSIDYSATAALERALKSAPDEQGRLVRALDGWREQSVAAFLAAYRQSLGDTRLWPRSLEDADRLLDFFLLEKAFYEIEYELAHRPDWLRVPLAGTWRILAALGGHARMSSLSPEAYAVIEGRHSDPFHYLGPHVEGDVPLVRVFLPDAEGVAIIDDQGHESGLQRIHDAGLFEGRLSNGSRRYRVRARYGERQVEIEDPYRFPPILSDLDLHLLGEGTHMHLYEKLGAHPMILDEVPGVAFAVFAPTARRVSVVGDFNSWDGRRHAMRVRGNGFWEIFVPEASAGRQVQVRDHRAGRPHVAVEIRSVGVRGRVAAARRLRSWWTRTRSRVRSPRPPTSTRCMRRCRSTKCISAHGVAGRRRAAGG